MPNYIKNDKIFYSEKINLIYSQSQRKQLFIVMFFSTSEMRFAQRKYLLSSIENQYSFIILILLFTSSELNA